MKRSLAVFLWILVGALASGVGVGYFLHAANADRRELVSVADRAKQEAEAAQLASEKLASEANAKVAAASAEVAKAQKLLKEYQDEQLLRTQAVTPEKPTARELKRWSQQMSVGLGVTLSIPPGTTAFMTDASLVSFTGTTDESSAQWLSISPYNASQEQLLAQSLQHIEPIKYLVNNRLILGVRGTLSDLPGNVYVLRDQSSATSTHLIWARSNALISDTAISQTLATLSFRS